MQKISELFIDNIKGLPIWVKQIMAKEISDDLTVKLENFTELLEVDDLFQYMIPKITFKGKQELQEKNLNLSDGYYIFLQDISDKANIFEITVKNNWSLADCAKIFVRCLELEYVTTTSSQSDKNIAVAMFIAGKIKTGEFLKKIKKINIEQLERAIRYQKELNEEGKHIKMASILIKMGYITDKGLDSLLLLKEEARKRMPSGVGLASFRLDDSEVQQDQIIRMQREITRLENENTIMKKRLKKILHIND